LVYVTPWNKIGYNITELYSTKFNLISPVWFQIKCIEKEKGIYLYIEGSHNVNKEWMNNVKNNYRGNGFVKIIPRFEISDWSNHCYQHFFGTLNHYKELSSLILDVCLKYNFHGIVFEWGYIKVRNIMHVGKLFLQSLKKNFTNYDMTLVLVIPAIRNTNNENNEAFLHQDFIELYDHVDRFSLMTYDYNQKMSPGPNSPLDWVLSSCMYC
jgi:hypothetical protein